MADFFHEFCTDGQARLIGVYFDTDADTTLIEVLPERTPSVTIKDTDAGNPVLLGDGFLGFCGSYSDVFGAINCQSGAFWTKSGKVRFHGLDSDGSSFAVQIDDELIRINSASGEQLSSRPVANEIAAIGGRWIAESSESEVVLIQDDLEPLRFSRSNYLGDIVESNGHIILNERQGPLRIVPLGTHDVVQEIIPDRGSEFRRAAISDNGLLTYTQHFFEEPRTTYVHQRLLTDEDDLHRTTIGVSGHNQLVQRGAQILFATCQLFDTTTGTEIGRI
ncbi:MAG: hypothetical protein P1U86_14990 [Verrucomicrobiales bacterium]|nr:hypothetical protein [Verrucomicrobiales bacterium]